MQLARDRFKRRTCDRLHAELFELSVLGRISAAALQFSSLISSLARCLQTDPHGRRTNLGVVAQRNAFLLASEEYFQNQRFDLLGATSR